jgi:hypothetical protein
MGTEIDPFIAGLPLGVVFGAAPLLTPRLFASLVAVLFVCMVYSLWSGGLNGMEQTAQSLMHELTCHGRMVFGMGAGCVLSFSGLRNLLSKR